MSLQFKLCRYVLYPLIARFLIRDYTHNTLLSASLSAVLLACFLLATLVLIVPLAAELYSSWMLE